MTEPTATKARKPEGNLDAVKVAEGLKKEPQAEVSGHISPGAYYHCWSCGAVNWVPRGWNHFYCWNDYVLNLV
jgi:hypothetical protein